MFQLSRIHSIYLEPLRRIKAVDIDNVSWNIQDWSPLAKMSPKSHHFENDLSRTYYQFSALLHTPKKKDSTMRRRRSSPIPTSPWTNTLHNTTRNSTTHRTTTTHNHFGGASLNVSREVSQMLHPTTPARNAR